MSVNRRGFLSGVSLLAGGVVGVRVDAAQLPGEGMPGWLPTQDPAVVKETVGVSHGDLKRVRELVEARRLQPRGDVQHRIVPRAGAENYRQQLAVGERRGAVARQPLARPFGLGQPAHAPRQPVTGCAFLDLRFHASGPAMLCDRPTVA